MITKRFSKIFCVLIFVFIFGCVATATDDARDYVEKSQAYYEKAVAAYKAKSDHLNLGLLYYSHGDYDKAIQELKIVNTTQAKKLLGISYYKLGDYTQALETLRQLEPWDDAEYLYYYGLSSERLNLYSQALNLYQKIRDTEYKNKASERINSINKSQEGTSFKDLDEETKDIILKAPAADIYPEAGSLILKCDENIEISEDDTLLYQARYLIKILNDRGKEKFSEIETEYDSTFEKIELVYARIIKPDGEVVYVGSKHIRDVSKYLNFPLYSNVRVHIISFPEITEGAVLDYKIKVYRNQLVNKKGFATKYSLQSSEPFIWCRFDIALPSQRRLNIKFINQQYNNFGAELRPKITESKNKKIYSWEFKNIPQIIPEQKMPPESEINPMILISTFDSWQEVYTWWQGLSQDKIKADAAIKNKTTQLIKGLTTDVQKARAIYNFCAQDIRYVAVEYGQGGYEPHFASEIFRNKYGDCKDQAILLVSMFREAGLEAYPVLISTKENNDLNEDFPSIQFNHAIACVKIDGEYIFLDPTAETCSFGDLPGDDQARKVLVFEDTGYKIASTPQSPAKNNLVDEELKISAGIDGSIQAEKKVYTRGLYDQSRRYWLLYTPPKLIEETLKEKIQELCVGARLEKYRVGNIRDLNKPTELEYSFRGSDYFVVAGDLYILPQLSSVNTAWVAKEERRYPIEFGILERFQKNIEIKIPHGLRVKFIPPVFEKDSPWMYIRAEYAFEKGALYYRETKELKKTSVALSQYQEFKKFIEEAAKSYKQRVVLEKLYR
ncbi:MAG: DUF3857 domain-containing protein [Candidatus Omnitrophica bacterium]|nr:DUF3857 domain-containing protein [Candidatus Omnitrophota bacterium]